MYIVTGASGWMGRTTLEYLKNQLKVNLQSDVRSFSSSRKEVQLSDGEVVRSESLERLGEIDEEVEGIFHYAFLTRDFVNKFGLNQYVAINNSILEKVAVALTSLKYGWVVGVSSGAVFDPGTNNLATDINLNPYGYLKLREESLLVDLSNQAGANCVIGRLWASSGHLMPIDRKYAISDFIYQGLTSQLIEVKSDHKVWRRYMDAEDFINVLHTLAMKGFSKLLDSTGDLVEIRSLASKIGLVTNARVKTLDNLPSSPPDLYYPEGDEMSELITKYGLSLKSLERQVKETIQGHARQLKLTER